MLRSVDNKNGFTLIELSVVLVIIGLIVGGTLVGRDLIKGSETQATITQIMKYESAVHAFQVKYEFLPGDIPDPQATQLGFLPRGSLAGQGNGDGILMGWNGNANCGCYGWVEGAGETVMLWVDLSTAKLIDGSFNIASPTTVPSGPVTGTALASYFPPAKLGNGNYLYAFSPYAAFGFTGNYIGISAPTTLTGTGGTCTWCLASNPNLTVIQAQSMDKKVDDGFPTTGNVIAMYADYVSFTNQGTGWAPNAANDSPSTCYNTTLNTYSTAATNSGNGLNCGLSFKLQ